MRPALGSFINLMASGSSITCIIFSMSNIICERFNDATYAYQGFARGFDLNLLMDLTKIATSGLEPDLTILLDLEVEKGLLRAENLKNHRDRLESERRDGEATKTGYFKAKTAAKNNPPQADNSSRNNKCSSNQSPNRRKGDE
jgi:thymidylate kinase